MLSAVAAVSVLTIARAQAVDIVVDAFDQVGVDDTFPLNSASPIPATTLTSGLSGGDFGGTRQIDVNATFLTLPSLPAPTITANANLDPGTGLLTATPEAGYGLRLSLLYFGIDSNDAFVPANLNVLDQDGLLIQYASESDVEVQAILINSNNGIDIVGSIEALFTLTGGQSSFLAPISLFDTINPSATNVDMSSVDEILLVFNTTAPSNALTLDRVAFVPEPATLVLATLGLGMMLSRRRRA